jgi:predicted phosphodiesterase
VSELTDKLNESTSDLEQAMRAARASPQEWVTGIQLDANGGVGVTPPRELEVGEVVDPYASVEDWAKIFRDHWHLDPVNWTVVDDEITVNSWQGQRGASLGGGLVTMVQYKARLRRRNGPQDQLVEKLATRAERRKKWKRTPPAGDLSFVLCVGDTQIGKPDGDGTYGSIGRWEKVITELPFRVSSLRKTGLKIGTGVVAFLGDLKEGCSGHYASQAFGVEMNNRDQDRTVVELGLATIEEMARLFPEVKVVAVPGNHGERRSGANKAYTNEDDNDDVALIEQVRRITLRDPNLGGVLYRFPDSQDLTVTADISGTTIGFVHGHQFAGGAGLEGKAGNWWRNQAHGRQLIGDATILVAGHHHHLLYGDTGSKVFVGTPAMDGGSNWWRHKNGADGPPGAVSFVAGEGMGPRGIGRLEILGSGPLFVRDSTA